MKFKINKETIYSAIRKANNCITDGLDNTALNGVLFEVTEDQLILSATNTKLYSREVIDLEASQVEETGSIVAEYKLLKSLLSDFPDGEVEFNHAGNKLKVAVENSEYTVPVYDPEMYPEYPTIDNKATIFEIRKSILKDLMKRLTKTTKKDSSNKPCLEGICIDLLNEEKISLVSTDQYRMYQFEFNPSVLDIGSIEQAIVPTDFAKYLKSNLDNEDKMITIELGDSFVKTKIKNTTIISRVIGNSKYPDYELMIPEYNELNDILVINTTEIKNALKRIKSVNSYNDTNVVNCFYNGDKLELIPEIHNGESSGQERVSVNYDGELNKEMKINFNTGWVLDYINGTKEDIVELGITENRKQAVFTEGNLTYLLLPVRS